jgi:peptidyl-prolyl cis-trans isomerase D
MMQAIRTRAGSIVVKVLFGLLILSFGFWGIYTRSDYYQAHSPDTVVAAVGADSIRAEDLQQALEPALERLRAQFGTAIDPRQVKQLGILDRLLGQLIDRSLVDQEAAKLGLDVSDEAIRNTIYANPAFRGPDGTFDRQLFAQVLSMNRLSEDQLVARLRHDIPRSDLLQAITTGVGMPRPVVDALYRYRNEKRLADIVAFPAASVTDIGEPSPTDLEKFYEAHPNFFRAPEYRSFSIASLSPTDLEQPGEIAEDELRKNYEERKDEFETPDRRDIQQILSPSEEKANEAEAALASGKHWNEVAATIAGQDPETIDLGLLSRQEIPHELGDVAFDLALNQPSQPIKSPLGWHILRVVRIEPAATQSFDQVKPQIEAELKRQNAVDRLDKIGNQADDALAGGAALADVAAKFQLKTATVAASDEGGRDPEGKAVTLSVPSDEILKTVFATNQGDTSRIIDMKDGSIFAVHVDKITPPTVRPLAEVKGQAVAVWQAEQKREAATQRAEALAAAVTPGLALAKAARGKGLTLLPEAPLSRGNTPGQTVSSALVAKLFEAKPGDVVTASDETGGYVAQLKEIQSPETIPDEAAAGLSDQLAGEARVGIADEFTGALRRRFPVEIQREALDRMF